MTRLEKQRIIVEYMGYKPSSEDSDFVFYESTDGIITPSERSSREFYYNRHIEIRYGAPFDRLWEWLIPVISKVTENWNEPEELDSLKYAMFAGDIEQAYNIVVDLIQNIDVYNAE